MFNGSPEHHADGYQKNQGALPPGYDPYEHHPIPTMKPSHAAMPDAVPTISTGGPTPQANTGTGTGTGKGSVSDSSPGSPKNGSNENVGPQAQLGKGVVSPPCDALFAPAKPGAQVGAMSPGAKMPYQGGGQKVPSVKTPPALITGTHSVLPLQPTVNLTQTAGTPFPPPVPPPPPINPEDLPADPIKLEDGLEAQEYYHGMLPREDIQALLRKDGDFVLRVTEFRDKGKKPVRELCLSVVWRCTTHHILLRPKLTGRFVICNAAPGEKLKEFDSVVEMLTYYLRKGKPFSSNKMCLVTPVLRQDWELRHEWISTSAQLGAGAFGAVFAGELKRPKKRLVKVAVKKLKVEKVDKKKIEELMHEARVMRCLKHKNVVRCHGIAADSEPLMILMELVNGGALDFFLKTHNSKVSLNERLNMCLDAALGLDYVHRKNILHRDIAARNCLYDGKVVKISDFGLSILGDRHEILPSEKAPVRWLPPEVFRTHVYSRSADVWAYGILIYEVFTNASEPYAGWTGAQIRETVLTRGNSLVPPEWVGPQVQKLFNEVLAFEPNQRLVMAEVAKRLAVMTNRRIQLDSDEDSDDDEEKEKEREKEKEKEKEKRRKEQRENKKERDKEQRNDKEKDKEKEKEGSKARVKASQRAVRGGGGSKESVAKLGSNKDKRGGGSRDAIGFLKFGSKESVTKPKKSTEKDKDDKEAQKGVGGGGGGVGVGATKEAVRKSKAAKRGQGSKELVQPPLGSSKANRKASAPTLDRPKSSDKKEEGGKMSKQRRRTKSSGEDKSK